MFVLVCEHLNLIGRFLELILEEFIILFELFLNIILLTFTIILTNYIISIITLYHVNIEIFTHLHLMERFYYIFHKNSSSRTKLYYSKFFQYIVIISYSNLSQK